ncbi:MAG: bifunctional 23S rRNA (guanine(2069)-N(7))-methyltransferase RlmK/23S rRNA (guanine(2445)-N(2))-methyltransferase RlmL [Nevskiales bacterium]
MNSLQFFASAARGVEPLLADELRSFGADSVKEKIGGVEFSGTLETAYRACLWSRLASRVLLPLSRFPLAGAEDLYAAAHALPWEEHFSAQDSFAVQVAGRSSALTHTHYAALKAKDGVADRFRERGGTRPDVDTEQPDWRLHLHLDGDHASLSLDLSGESLHRRGYRRAGVEAPLRETLAAALLVRAGWPAFAAQGASLLDPMCGSGTLLLEAALMASDTAPGLQRERFGFERWQQHLPKLWQDLKEEAELRKQEGLKRALPELLGRDADQAAIEAAQANARRAGFAEKLRFERGDLTEARPIGAQPGLLITNPPYGERLGDEMQIIKLYSLLGTTLRQHFAGWRVAVFTARPDLGPRLGLSADKMYALYNGPLPCKLLLFDIRAEARISTEAAADFANRVRKNHKHLSKWARRREIGCYRVYDAELHDYAVAVDVYQSDELHLHVQEYAPPKHVDVVRAERRLREALAALQEIFDVPAARIHYKLRKPQRGRDQYERQDERKHFLEIEEHACRLWVNLDDYLDTGLFLDHRPLRHRLQTEAKDKRFLNLFCYTATATVHAAMGGANSTLSVDMSATYLDWAANNLELNGFRATLLERRTTSPARKAAHVLQQADCLLWLQEQADSRKPQLFDLILLDPPTFSNSKRMEETLDVQRDHVELIRLAARLLAPGGTLYFSTNRRRFKLDQAALAQLTAQDITTHTLDEDFKRPPPPHRCWKFTLR